MNPAPQVPLRFPPVEGLTLRADFEGGALSSDFGPLLLRGVDRQIGLTRRLAEAFQDRRHPSYIEHSIQALLAQRIYQIGCAYEDGNDANALRTDPVFKLALEHKPLEEAAHLASAPTFSRLENAATSKDLYRIAVAFVDHFIARYAQAPTLIVLDLDHSEDTAHGQQESIFYNPYYGSHCYLPLFIFRRDFGPVHHRRLAPRPATDGCGKRYDRPAGVEASARHLAGNAHRLARRQPFCQPRTDAMSAGYPAHRLRFRLGGQCGPLAFVQALAGSRAPVTRSAR